MTNEMIIEKLVNQFKDFLIKEEEYNCLFTDMKSNKRQLN